MRIASRLLVAAAVCALGAPSIADAARGLPMLCPGGRFTVATPPIVTGGATVPGGTLTIVQSAGDLRVSLGTACRAEEQLGASLARRKRGSRLAVAWSSCAGAQGRVRLRGVISADGCAVFTGTLKARGLRLRLDASRATVICGDGIVDLEEICDPTSETPGCSAGQGCIRSSEQCACAALCGGTRPADDALDAAIRAGLTAEPDALRDAAAFDRFRGGVQTALACALNAGSRRPPLPDPLPAPGGYNSATQYCGPGDSEADWRLGLLSPDPCLNVACYEHDRCNARGGGDCDATLLTACELCTSAATGGLFSWLTPDSFFLCSALRVATTSGVITTTTTTSVPPATLPGATSTSTSTISPTPTTSSTTSTALTSSTALPPTVTSTSSSTSTTASAVGKDLIPEQIVLGADEVPAGSAVSVTWDVTNHGTVAVTESWCDKLYLSADAALDGGDAMVDSQCHFGVYDPGEGDRRTLSVTIPAAAPPGPAYLLIETDVQLTVTEGNEANNIAAAPFTVTAAAP